MYEREEEGQNDHMEGDEDDWNERGEEDGRNERTEEGYGTNEEDGRNGAMTGE